MQGRNVAVEGRSETTGSSSSHEAAVGRGRALRHDPPPGEAGMMPWRGHEIAFTRRGEGSPVLLVHGIHAGASDSEWRHTVPALAERHTVFTVDLLGFGRSDRPRVRYTPALYQALLGDVITRLVGGPCAVVASALSAAHLVSLAARDPRQIAVIALIAPTGVSHRRDVVPSESGASRFLLAAPLIGESVYRRRMSPENLRQQLESAYVDDRLVTPALVESYVRAARQPGSKHAMAAVLNGQLNVDVRVALKRVRQPSLLVWGDLARQNPVEHAHPFRVLKRDLEWALVQEAGDLPHDERPAEVNSILLSFLERARRWSTTDGPRLVMT